MNMPVGRYHQFETETYTYHSLEDNKGTRHKDLHQILRTRTWTRSNQHISHSWEFNPYNTSVDWKFDGYHIALNLPLLLCVYLFEDFLLIRPTSLALIGEGAFIAEAEAIGDKKGSERETRTLFLFDNGAEGYLVFFADLP